MSDLENSKKRTMRIVVTCKHHPGNFEENLQLFIHSFPAKKFFYELF